MQTELRRAEAAELAAQDIAQRRAEIAQQAKVKLPASQQRFAWNSDRIATALLSKFDTYTNRHEDHTRKLLWTFGTDPHFKEPGSMAAMKVTPANFPRVTDRFGIACTEAQAHEIFARHGLPADGVSMPKLSSAFVDSKLDMANIVRDQARRMHGDAGRPASVTRIHSPKAKTVPFKHAFVPLGAYPGAPTE